jgi:poly(3-hydroxybutyrate) depolymerase
MRRVHVARWERAWGALFVCASSALVAVSTFTCARHGTAAGPGGGTGATGGGQPASGSGGTGGGDAAAMCDAGAFGEAGTLHDKVMVNGVARTYLLDVPASATAAMAEQCAAPLVVALHGAGETGQAFVQAHGLETNAAAHGYVLLAPDALLGGWFLATCEGWTSPDGEPDSTENDMAFVQRIVADTSLAYRIDPTRVYLAGVSRGAAMAMLLATGSGNAKVQVTYKDAGQYTSPFAAYGVSAGYDPFNGTADLSTASPKRPVWIIHGTADNVIPFSWGQMLGDELKKAGWPVTFTAVDGGPHDWLWNAKYGHSNDELWSFFAANPG